MPSLRSTLTGTTALVGAIALLVAGALLVLTNILHRTTSGEVITVEGVRLNEEAEIDLLLHERSTDPLVRRDYEADLQRLLGESRRFVTSDEARAYEEAVANVSRYLHAAQDTSVSDADRATLQEDAYGALEALVTINVDQAMQAQRDGEWWDRIADALGVGGGVLLVVVGATLVWIRWRAFGPLFSLADAMERYGRGERDARAREDGLSELREMSRRFNEMASALEAQRRAQMAFLGGVAHDLRTPLSVLKLSMAMVHPERPLPPEPVLRPLLHKVDRQIAHLERMMGDLLDVANLESGALELRLAQEDARALVRDVVELFDGPPSEHRIEVRLPDRQVTVRCDQVRMEQVVTNLISNALKYSPPGTPVEVVVEDRGDEAILQVTDRGVGIAEKDRERVFEPFRRLGPPQGSIPGVGLGLFVVRRIVEAHGGHIELDSAPGAGSTFRICLPREPGRTGVAPGR